MGGIEAVVRRVAQEMRRPDKHFFVPALST
jgi:hypothetical protein